MLLRKCGVVGCRGSEDCIQDGWKEETAAWDHTSDFNFVDLEQFWVSPGPGCGHRCVGTKWPRNESHQSVYSGAASKMEVIIPHSGILDICLLYLCSYALCRLHCKVSLKTSRLS